jgi:hypothetical protein
MSDLLKKLSEQEQAVIELRAEVRESFTAAAKGASTPAPKKDKIKGSKKNKKGSASGGKSIIFSKSVEDSLRKKVTEHNKTASKGRKATLAMLKAVYRRGAGAYSTSHRPGKTRGQWAMARVNAFLKLLRSGKPSNSAYKQDNDLLPTSHPRSSKKSASALVASGLIPEEHALAEALISVVEAHGKFDQDGDGVWAGYTPAAENEDAGIGVKCANCVFYQGNGECRIISLEVEPEGKCRFAVLPEGAVEGYDIPQRDSADLELLLATAYAVEQLSANLGEFSEYQTTEDAIIALAELSEHGYESEFALRASWIRAVQSNEDPFERAKQLALDPDNSPDKELLPRII